MKVDDSFQAYMMLFVKDSERKRSTFILGPKLYLTPYLIWADLIVVV